MTRPDVLVPTEGEASAPPNRSAGWPTPTFMRESGLVVAQSNGELPQVVLAAEAPGDHGISFMRNLLTHGVESLGTSLHHVVFVTVQTEGRITTSIAGQSQTFVPRVGTIAVIPAGADCGSRGAGEMAAFVLMIPKETLAFAAAERARAGATVVERLAGEDPALLHLCHLLARYVSDGCVDDPLAWYELTDAVVQRMVDAHLSAPPQLTRGRLSPKALARVIDCIHANVDRPLSVEEIADAAQQSWSHFPRLFRRSTGLSPYQYVIKVRLQLAMALLRSTKLTIAEVAARSGFADQSHFCRWVRRAYGAAPSQLVADLRAAYA